MTSSPTEQPLLSVSGLYKQFSSTPVLRGVELTAEKGEVLALLGLNGAGKSTLVKILAGALKADEGRMSIAGRQYAPRSVADAQAGGVSVVYQQRTLIPQLTVAQNIFLGDEPDRAGLVREKDILRRADELLRRIQIDIDPSVVVGQLGAGQQQLVDVARAIKREARIVILDEPTAALTQNEAQHLFDVVRRLRDQGLLIIFVSHRLDEVFALCDRVAVLRDGVTAVCSPIETLTEQRVVSLMIAGDDSVEATTADLYRAGSDTDSDKTTPAEPNASSLVELTPRSNQAAGKPVIRLGAGEVVGLAGQVGAGCTAVLEYIAGVHDELELDLRVRGRSVHWRAPSDAIAERIVLLPEDRAVKAIAAEMGVRANISLPALSAFSRFGLVRQGLEKEQVQSVCDRFSVVMSGLDAPLKSLSGGNQQKTVFARWLLAVQSAMADGFSGTVFLLDEPTEGVDVKTRPEIASAIRDFAERGAGVLMASTDTDELLAVCDRVYVLVRGELVGEYTTRQLSRERLSALTMAA